MRKEGEKVTDTMLLRAKIEESGYRLKFIAKKLGITYAGLLKKINNETEFKASEIQKLANVLKLDLKEKEEIFFAKDVDETSTCIQ